MRPSESIDAAILVPEYRQWWRTFRQHSNESSVIARHLARHLTARLRSHGKSVRVADIGCGDGEVLAESWALIDEDVRRRVDEVFLVDPLECVERAADRMGTLIGSTRVRAVQARVEDLWPLEAASTFAILSHSAYYIDPLVCRQIVDQAGVGGLVVLDGPDSVFASCWGGVNHVASLRLLALHEWLLRVSSSQWTDVAIVNDAESLADASSPVAAWQENVLSLLALQDWQALRAEDRYKLRLAASKHVLSSGALPVSLTFHGF